MGGLGPGSQLLAHLRIVPSLRGLDGSGGGVLRSLLPLGGLGGSGGASFQLPAKGRYSKPIALLTTQTELLNPFECLKDETPNNGDTSGVSVFRKSSVTSSGRNRLLKYSSKRLRLGVFWK